MGEATTPGWPARTSASDGVALVGDPGVPIRQSLLDPDSRGEGRDDACKFREHGIARVMHDFAVVRPYGVRNKIKRRTQLPVRAELVLAREAAVTHDVRVQDRR